MNERNEALEEAAKICECYYDWAPQWGQHCNEAIAQKAAEDCAAKIRTLIKK